MRAPGSTRSLLAVAPSACRFALIRFAIAFALLLIASVSRANETNARNKVLWQYPTIANRLFAPLATVAVDSDGSVYANSLSQLLYALNRDGSEKWRFDARSLIWGDVALASNGTLYVGSKTMFALRPDGSLKWRFPSSGAANDLSAPAISKAGQIYFTSEGRLFALRDCLKSNSKASQH